MTDEIVTVGAEELERAIREVAAESPGYVYKRAFVDDGPPICAYFDGDGCPSCLVGQGLARLGVTLGSLRGLNAVGVSALFEDELIETGAVPERWFTVLQDAQDFGNPWGEAVKMADAALLEDDEDD